MIYFLDTEKNLQLHLFNIVLKHVKSSKKESILSFNSQNLSHFVVSKKIALYYLNNSLDLLKSSIQNVFHEMKMLWNNALKEYNLLIVKKFIEPPPLIVICNHLHGGSFKFIKDIINAYYHEPFINKVTIVKCKKSCKKEIMKYKNSLVKPIVLLQYFLFTNLNVSDIINLYEVVPFRLIIPIHDWYWLCYPYPIYYKSEINCKYLDKLKLSKKTIKLFNISKKIICPTEFLYKTINNLYNSSKVIFNPWIDISMSLDLNPNVLEIVDNTINIAMLHELCEYKGSEILETLMNGFTEYKNYKIKYYFIGENSLPRYEENMQEHIIKYNIHGLLHLNKWKETYCYALTKSLNSGLPIFFNNIGAYETRIPLVEKYFINSSSEK